MKIWKYFIVVIVIDIIYSVQQSVNSGSYCCAVLKILQNGSTLHGPVSVAEFSSLSQLEIHRLPVQYIRGLERQRNTVRSLTCIACITSLHVSWNTCSFSCDCHSLNMLKTLYTLVCSALQVDLSCLSSDV